MLQSISSEVNRELFLEILTRCDVQEYNIKYAESGWYGLQDHYSASYDRIKFDVVMPVIRAYQDSIGMEEALREDSYNEIAGTIMRELLAPCIPNLIRIFWANVNSGFITTILKVHPLLNIAAAFLYLVWLSLFAWLAAKGAYRNKDSVLPFAVLAMISLVALIVFTSMTIYCQMRYMLYNTGLFYQSGLLMLWEAWRMQKE